MKRFATILPLSLLFVLIIYTCCSARSVTVQDDLSVFETEDDIKTNNPLGMLTKDSIADAFYSDKLIVDGVEYVLSIGRYFENGEAVYTKGYVETDKLSPICKNIRSTNELSSIESRSLVYAARNAIEDGVGISPTVVEEDLISKGYLDIQLDDHCAVVSFKDEENTNGVLFKTEFLFTLDEHMVGEYRVLYVEQNGKGVFGNYEPFAETAMTENLLGVSFSGFTYED